MKLCPFCGRAIDDDARYCSGCGKKIVRCPRCGEHSLHPLSETTTSVQTSGGGYSSRKGCLGWLLFGPVGLLCGGLGQKQRTSIHTDNKLYWICNECGTMKLNLK